MMLKQLRLILLKVFGRRYYEILLFALKNYYVPDLNNPKTFNEIISSRKIYSKSTELQILCSDKLKVRDYVAEKIGSEFLTDLHDIIYAGQTILTDKWPERIVLKANHASGKKFLRILDDVSKENQIDLQKWADHALNSDYGIITNEFWYNEINPRAILVEEKLNPSGRDLKDYKFLMVNGDILFIQVDQGRFTNHTRNLYSEDWASLNYTFGYPMGEWIDKPTNLNLMIKLSKLLSSGFDLCRVDLYEDEFDRVKFGEITFSPDAGWGRFIPKDYDLKSGMSLKAKL